MSSDRVTLQVTARDADQVGSRRVRRLRREGMVPGVLYGKGHTRPLAVASVRLPHPQASICDHDVTRTRGG